MKIVLVDYNPVSPPRPGGTAFCAAFAPEPEQYFESWRLIERMLEPLFDDWMLIEAQEREDVYHLTAPGFEDRVYSLSKTLQEVRSALECIEPGDDEAWLREDFCDELARYARFMSRSAPQIVEYLEKLPASEEFPVEDLRMMFDSF